MARSLKKQLSCKISGKNRKRFPMNKKILFLLTFVLVSPFASHAAHGVSNTSLEEANRHFTYQGKPIYPGLVQAFTSNSDMPTIITVDISAWHENAPVKKKSLREGQDDYCINIRDSGDEEDGGSFCYEWLGKLHNGLHVLATYDQSGGGSSIFMELLFVRFDKGMGYTQEGKKYDQLLMSTVRKFTLYDRDDGEIMIKANKVIIGKSRFRDKPVELSF